MSGSSNSSLDGSPAEEGNAAVPASDLLQALTKGLPTTQLQTCLRTHELVPLSGDVTEEVLAAQESLLRELLTKIPWRVPSVSELRAALILLDTEYSLALSAARSRKAQRHWCTFEAEKVRAMLAHVRKLTRKSKTSRSRNCRPFEFFCTCWQQPGCSDLTFFVGQEPRRAETQVFGPTQGQVQC